MTYKELLEQLKTLSEEQLESDLTVESEYGDVYWIADFRVVGPEQNVLDDGHPVISILNG